MPLIDPVGQNCRGNDLIVPLLLDIFLRWAASDETVANAWLSQHMARHRWIRLDLPADVTHMESENLDIAEFTVPQLVKEMRMCHDSSRMDH